MIILRFTGTNDTLFAWLLFLCWPMITQEQSQSFSLIVAGGSKSECVSHEVTQLGCPCDEGECWHRSGTACLQGPVYCSGVASGPC